MKKLTIEEIKRIFAGRPVGTVGEHKFFAVLVPLVVGGCENCKKTLTEDVALNEEEISLLYEVRGKSLHRQPGEICFPGGAIEAGETPLQCAIRETCEELGINREDIEIINKMDTLHTMANFTIYSYLAQINIDRIKINQVEVESVFTVPVTELIKNPPEIYTMTMLPKIHEGFPYEKIDFMDGYKWRTGRAEVPIYQYKDKVIWGITARITHKLIEVIEESLDKTVEENK